LVGEKTVILTGFFKGQYGILAGHEPSALVPVLQFDAGGEAGIEQTLPEAYNYVAVRAQVNNVPLGPPVTVVVNGVVGAGQNQFATLATLAPGNMGAQPSIDTYAIFPPTGLEEGISIICSGLFEGNIMIEGSEDNATWNPIGQFTATPIGRNLLGLSRLLGFGPLSTSDLVRYVRVNVGAKITGPTVVTIGGRIPAAAGGAGVSSIAGEDSTGRATVINAVGEEILYEEPVDLTSVPAGHLLFPSFAGVLRVSLPSTGTFRLYLGGTPGSTAGATLLATLTTTSLAKALVSGVGAPLPNPGGTVLLQITGVNNNSEFCVSEISSCSWRLS
jgi:hypothetical protein